MATIKAKLVSLYKKVPDRSYEDLNNDLADLRAAMIDLWFIMESYVKGVFWLISLPVRILTGLASLAVALAVLLPIILILFIAFGKSNGTALEQASQNVSDRTISWFSQHVDNYTANHPNSIISRTLDDGSSNAHSSAPAGVCTGHFAYDPATSNAGGAWLSKWQLRLGPPVKTRMQIEA